MSVEINKSEIKFKAVFIGKTNIHFKYGIIYELTIPKINSLTITEFYKRHKVTYESLSAFLRNWSHIIIEQNGK